MANIEGSQSILSSLDLPKMDGNRPFNRDLFSDGQVIRYRNGYPQDDETGNPAIELFEIGHHERVVNGKLHAEGRPAVWHEWGKHVEFWENGVLLEIRNQDGATTEAS